MCAMPALKRPAFLDGWSRSAGPADDAPEDEADGDGGAESSPARRQAPQGGPFRVVVSDAGEACFAQDFEAGEFLIGASPTADVIIPDLDDDEVASVRLEATGAACVVTLTPLAPGVIARGREIEIAQPVLFPGRAVFTIAEFDFAVTFTPPTRPVRPGAGPALLVAGAILAGAAAWIVGRGAPDTVAEPPPAPPLKQTLVEQIAPPAERMTSAAEGMRLALAAANLAPPVRVAPEQGRLVLSGTVSPDERARAFDVIASMRARSDLPVEVALVTDPDGGMMVAAVFLEPAAFMVGRDGRRYTPGQRLPDGGVLEALDETSVLVNRDGVRERLYYSR